MGCYDLTTVLSTMTACTATFVAIIGGLIASKAIADSSEKDIVERQLKQIEEELSLLNSKKEDLEIWMLLDDVEEYIYNHIDDLLELKKLEDVYVETDDNRLTYDELIEYWNSGIELVQLYRQAIENNENCNNDNIPISIINELTPFQNLLCTFYGGYIKDGDTIFNMEYLKKRRYAQVEKYEQTEKILENISIDISKLRIKEEILTEQKIAFKINPKIKNGIRIFLFVSVLNIIMPIIFLLFNPTLNKTWYIIESTISYSCFCLGIVVMINYIYSLFPKETQN